MSVDYFAVGCDERGEADGRTDSCANHANVLPTEGQTHSSSPQARKENRLKMRIFKRILLWREIADSFLFLSAGCKQPLFPANGRSHGLCRDPSEKQSLGVWRTTPSFLLLFPHPRKASKLNWVRSPEERGGRKNGAKMMGSERLFVCRRLVAGAGTEAIIRDAGPGRRLVGGYGAAAATKHRTGRMGRLVY